MPRPSLKKVRTEELLDAFMKCVARFGLDGSTLERISDEAGVGRPLLRHYLGNREEMVTQLLDYVLSKFDQMTHDLITGLPQRDRANALIDILFSNRTHKPENATVYQALVAASDRYPGMHKKLFAFLNNFETSIAKELMLANPSADIHKCKIISAGISAIYFNTDAAMPLQPPNSWRARQKAAALILLESI